MSITSVWSETSWQCRSGAAPFPLPGAGVHRRPAGRGQTGIPAAEPVCEPRFETRADWEIVGGLAQRMGFQGLSFESAPDLWNFQLEGTGVKAQDFDQKGVVELTGQAAVRPVAGRVPVPDGFGEDRDGEPAVGAKQGLPSFGPTRRRRPRHRDIPADFRRLRHSMAGGHTINNPLLSPSDVRKCALDESGRGQEAEDRRRRHGGRVHPGPDRLDRVRVTEFIHPEAVFMVPGFGRTLPVESRARGHGIAHNRFMPGGLAVTDAAGGGLALQEHWSLSRSFEIPLGPPLPKEEEIRGLPSILR